MGLAVVHGIITDYTMPHMTGTDLAGELQRLCPGLPVILCTGYAEAISQAELKAFGIRELIIKPLSTTTFAQSIRRVLDGERGCS